MSTVPQESIEVISQSLGINNLAPEVLPGLASDVEFHVREIMQEAIKCMRHSKRTTLTSEDVDSALGLRNVEPIHGFASGDPLRFKKAAGHNNLYYIRDKDVEFKDVIDAPLPKAPLDTTLVAHWLAIEGVQPAIPENATLEVQSDNRKAEYREDGVSVDVKLPVKHVLSRELQLYFEKITELTVSRSSSILFKEALVSLATDSGLHPLVPYFAYFIADEVSRNLNNSYQLIGLMRLVWSLLQNPHIHIEPYLHQLMPSVMTCLVAKKLGNKFSDNHWELRNFTADLVALICKRYGHVYHNLQPRVTRTLVHTFLDPTKALPQHFGAIQGLAALGPSVVRLLVLPNLEPYLRLLEPEMLLEKQKNGMSRLEAWHVYGALIRAVGLCMYNRLKKLPTLLPPLRAMSRSNPKVITKIPSKRKATVDNMMQQPPLKKLATNGPMGSLTANSVPVDMSGTSGGYAANIQVADSSFPSISKTFSNENVRGISARRDGVASQGYKSSAVLQQAWKEEFDTGNLLPLLYEYFGESMLNFVPTPELSLLL
ncbi:transcription initiation factor TFIID subunit 6-like isoform X1 [Coffea arabica]|uniref:Transcription initiation factor TFIID subunit 6-like isoform X1 n=1 Tax=Coffea arabica TaxID=13443 RepID=A0A6P6SDU0_COFAR|nr:transcription initiation factor TFIID subunit 6-like isoform X1 [Coffea arabica]